MSRSHEQSGPNSPGHPSRAAEAWEGRTLASNAALERSAHGESHGAESQLQNFVSKLRGEDPTFFARLDSKVNLGFQAENFGMASSASLLAGMKSSDLS